MKTNPREDMLAVRPPILYIKLIAIRSPVAAGLMNGAPAAAATSPSPVQSIITSPKMA